MRLAASAAACSDSAAFWITQVTINFARDQELMRLAKESCCHGVFIGFETFSNQSIRDAGKGVNRPVAFTQRGSRSGGPSFSVLTMIRWKFFAIR